MKLFIYFLGIVALGHVGALHCTVTKIVDDPEAINIQTLSLWDGASDLATRIAMDVSEDIENTQYKNNSQQMSRQEFEQLVRKHLAEQKIFLRYMQVTGISMTFLMAAVAAIMGSAFLKVFRD